MTGYPPEPWLLHGSACVSVWLVDVSALPALPAHLPVRPVTVRGRAVVGTAFVDYRPPGMVYRELLAAVLVRRGPRPGVSITDIWVDSPASRAGGRELWGIPKELAEFTGHTGRTASEQPIAARDDDGPIARVSARPSRFGVRLPLATSTWQALGATAARTPLRATARVAPARAAWEVDPAGPLAWLLPHRPLATVAVRDFRLRFGPRARGG